MFREIRGYQNLAEREVLSLAHGSAFLQQMSISRAERLIKYLAQTRFTTSTFDAEKLAGRNQAEGVGQVLERNGVPGSYYSRNNQPVCESAQGWASKPDGLPKRGIIESCIAIGDFRDF